MGIYAQYPHGSRVRSRFPLFSFRNPTTYQPYGAILGASMLKELLPGVGPVSGIVASILFKVPVLRQLMHCLGAREASSRMIHRMFAEAYQVKYERGWTAGGGV